jgi:hypothetical protein
MNWGVNGRAETLPAYRRVTPAVCAMSEMEPAGIEPATSAVPRRRSPS